MEVQCGGVLPSINRSRGDRIDQSAVREISFGFLGFPAGQLGRHLLGDTVNCAQPRHQISAVDPYH